MPDIEQRVLTPWAALSALVLGGALAGVAAGGAVPSAVVVALAAVMMGYGWPRLLDLPSPRGVQAVLLLAVVAMVGAALLGDGRDLRWVPVALAITVVGSFLHQLLRRDGRARLVATLGGTALAAGLVAGGACFVGAAAQDDGALLVLAAAIAVVFSTALDWLLHARRGAAWTLPLSVLVAAAGAAGLALATSVPVAAMIFVAAGSAVVAHAVRRLLSVVATAAAPVSQVTIGAAALLSTGALPYVAAWLIEWFTTH